MRRFLPIVLLTLLLATPAFAAPPTPMLWKVSGNGSNVYLLGSMHLLQSSDYPLSPDVDTAYQHAQKLVFEIAPDELTSPETLALTMQHGTYQDHTHKLQDDLPASTWKQLVAYGANNFLPEEKLQTFEPWLVSQTILVLESMKMGMTPQSGLDMHFIDMAKADHKPTAGLETASFQLEILYSAPLKVQQEMLQESLDEIAVFKKEMDEEHDTWRRGDGDALAAQAKKEFAKYPDLYKKLVLDRNESWVPQVEKMLSQPGANTLMIVGALHLSGSDGVVSLLRKKGYKVDRICTGCTVK